MSFRLTPAVSAALRSGFHPIAPLIEIALPGYLLCHLVGAGEVRWGNRTFLGIDPRFGVLTSAGTLRDGVGDDAPDWSLSFQPPASTSAALLTRAEAQGSEVRGWLAVVDRATGLIIPDPVQVFAGTLDAARLRVGKQIRTVEWRCASALEGFHDTERGMRLSDATHQLIWPGETGCANMTGVEKTSFWGVEKVPSGVTYGTGGGGGSEYLGSA